MILFVISVFCAENSYGTNDYLLLYNIPLQCMRIIKVLTIAATI